MKLTKEQRRDQARCIEILSQDQLSYDDKIFVLENYHEGATNDNGYAGAFFTPFDTARDFNLEVSRDDNLVDLCAGIGGLSYHVARDAELRYSNCKITCVEINPEYVAIGKKILPQAEWILGDITDRVLIEELKARNFTYAISNPPFGNIKTGANTWPFRYSGSDFEFKVVEIAAEIAEAGTFLLPQGSTPFLYSQVSDYDRSQNGGYYPKPGRSRKYDKFRRQTGIEFNFNMGIEVRSDNWKGVTPVCEIVNWEGVLADDYVGDLFSKQ